MTKDPRHTRQRSAIMSVFKESSHPLTPIEIRDKASKLIISIGIATVYRTLRFLTRSGEVERIAIPGMSSCYLLSRSGPRTFFCCNRTGTIRVASGARVEVKSSQLPNKFRPKCYEVIVYGSFEESLGCLEEQKTSA